MEAFVRLKTKNIRKLNYVTNLHFKIGAGKKSKQSIIAL